MKLLKTKPYELSVWKDSLKTVSRGSYYKETMLAKIGSSESSSHNEAFDIVLNQNVNGEIKLEFSMIHRYFSEEEGKIITNPFISYLINERKLKLKLEDEWYDFIIKNVEESSDSNTFKYTATNLYVNELAKGGYNVVFSNELANNQGTIIDLAKRAVEDTDWVIDEANSDPIRQWIQEPLYRGVLRESITVTETIATSGQPATLTINAGQIIYFFYSTIINKQEKDVHILLDRDRVNKKWDYDDNGVIRGTNYRITNPASLSFDQTSGIPTIVSSSNFGIYKEHQGFRLGYGTLSLYDPVTEKYVERYKVDVPSYEGQEIYRYTDHVYTTSDILTNFFSNGNSFNIYNDGSVAGWSTATPTTPLDPIVQVWPTYNKSYKRYNGPTWLKDEDDNVISSPSSYTIYQLAVDFLDNAGESTTIVHPKGTCFRYNSVTGQYVQVNVNKDSIQTIELDSIPALNLSTIPKLSEIDSIRSYLKVHFNGSKTDNNENTIFNSGIQDQHAIVGSFKKGEKYIFRIKSFRSGAYNDNDKPVLLEDNSIRAIVAGYTVGEDKTYRIDKQKIYFEFNSSGPSGTNYNLITGGVLESNNRVYKVTENNLTTVLSPSIQYVYQVKEGNTTKNYVWDPLKEVVVPGEGTTQGQYVEMTSEHEMLMKYKYYISECKQPLSNTDLANANIGIFIYSINSEQVHNGYYHWIEDIQLFKYREEEEGSGIPMMMGNVPTAKSVEMEYYYLPDRNVINGDDVVKYASLQALANELNVPISSIKPRYNSNYEKISSIEIEHSNYYNIIQELCEQFQCWAKFNVVHNDNGEIYINENTLEPMKTITFHEYVGKPNFVGFKYGINLNSIQRTYSSEEIVSKLIVASNDSEYVDGGLTIRRAASNPLKEDYILNFSYYLNKGLIDAEGFMEDLATFTTEISQLNVEIQALDQEFTDVTGKITKISGDRNTYTELLKAARIKLKEAEDYVYQVLGMTYDEFIESNNGKIRIAITPSSTAPPNIEVTGAARDGLEIIDYQGYQLYPQLSTNARVDTEVHEKSCIKITSIPVGYTYPTYKDHNGWHYCTEENYLYADTDTEFFKEEDGKKVVYLPLSSEAGDNDGLTDTLGEILTCQTVINGYSGLVSNLTNEYNRLYQLAYGMPEYTITISVYNGTTKMVINNFVDGLTLRMSSEYGTYDFKTSSIDRVFEYDREALYFTIEEILSGYSLYRKDGTTPIQIHNNEYLTRNTTSVYYLKPTNVGSFPNGLNKQIEEKNKQKAQVEKNFYKKYSRFIQEGTWTSEDYVENELYYLDALQVSNTSAMPKVEYSIKVSEISGLEDYESYKFEIGDKTYIEDTEFFGWVPRANDNEPKTPIREEVIVSQVNWHLDKPEENEIIVQNYKTRFEDLFQRISATVQTVEYNKGSYGRAAGILDSNGLINSGLLLGSLNNIQGDGIYNIASNGLLVSTPNGLTGISLTQQGHQIRFSSEGILASTDGGLTWTELLTSTGININYLNAGIIDTSQINIVDGNQSSFRWDSRGISAFAFDENDNYSYDFSKFVRFDKFGLYGIEGIDGLNGFNPVSIYDVKKNASFGAIWNEFFIRSKYDDAYVSMSSVDDFRVVGIDKGRESDIIKIGKLGETGGTKTTTYYDPISYREASGGNTDFVPNFREGVEYYVYNSILGEYTQVANPRQEDAESYFTKREVKTPEKIYGISIKDLDGNESFRADSFGNLTISGTLKSRNYTTGLSGWIIDREGDAEFNNAIIRGAIKSAVFEYEEIQAVGGLIYVRPATTITKVLSITKTSTTQSTNTWQIIFEVENIDVLKIPGSTEYYTICKISEGPAENNNYYFDVNSNNNTISVGPYITDIGVTEEYIKGKLEGAAFIALGKFNSGTQVTSHNFGIGINSTMNHSQMAPEAISLFEYNHVGDNRYRGIFGRLPNISQNQVSTIYTNNMVDTQGIYTDNMYIGDQNKYVAFYTDKVTNQKKLAIVADLISFSGGGNLNDTITTQEIQYTLSSSAENNDKIGGWIETMPNPTENYRYIWQRTVITHTDGEIEYKPTTIPEGEGFCLYTPEDGLNTALITLYQRSSGGAPAKPSNQTTYQFTFSSGLLTPIPQGWSISIPDGNDPCYVTTAYVASRDDVVIFTEWSDVKKFVQDGQDGKDGKKIIGSFIRYWTSSSWNNTCVIDSSVNITPGNQRSDGSGYDIPSWYSYQDVNVGDFIHLIGTGTDNGYAYTGIFEVTSKPTSQNADIPCKCVALNYAESGEDAADANVEIIVSNIDTFTSSVTFEATLFINGESKTSSEYTYRWVIAGSTSVIGTGRTLYRTGTQLDNTYECVVTWS